MNEVISDSATDSTPRQSVSASSTLFHLSEDSISIDKAVQEQ